MEHKKLSIRRRRINEHATRLETRISSLMGKVTHLSRVYWIVTCHSLFREGTMNAARNEFHEVLVKL
jgi:hypothetical protein